MSATATHTADDSAIIRKADLLAALRAVRGELKNGATPDFNTPGTYDVDALLPALDRTRAALDNLERLAREYRDQPAEVANVKTIKRVVLSAVPDEVRNYAGMIAA